LTRNNKRIDPAPIVSAVHLWQNAPVLFGREHEREILVAAFGRAALGHCHLITIEGQAGLGKSTLAAEALGIAEDLAFSTVICHTDESNGARPFGALIDGLRAYSDEAFQRLQTALDGKGEGLSSILVGVAPNSRESIIETFCAILEEFLTSSPLFLVVEDAHWADEATIETLRRVKRSLQGQPFVLLVTARPISEAVSRAWSSLRNEATAEITLDELNATDAKALVETTLGRAAGPNLQSLIGQAGGNPLLLIDLVRAIKDRDLQTGTQSDGNLWSIPPSLKERTLRTLETVRHEHRQLIQAVAVLGSSAFIADVGVVLGRPLAATNRMAIEAQKTGLLEIDGELLKFRHELTRAAVEDSIPEAERILLNRSAAQMLVTRDGSEAKVAFHLDRGRIGPSETTDQLLAGWLLRSAEKVRTQAPSLTLDLIDKARLFDPLEANKSVHLLVELEAASHAGRLDRAESVGSKLLNSDLSDVQRADMNLWLGACNLISQQALAAAERFHDGAATATPMQAALLLSYRALALLVAFDHRWRNAVEEALEAANRTGSKPATTIALGLKSRAYANDLECSLAVVASQSGCEIALSDKSEDSQRYVPYLFHTLSLYDLDRHHEARAAAETGRKAAESLGSWWGLSLYHGLFAWIHYTTGDLEIAEAESLAGVVAAEETGSRMTVLWCFTVLGLIAVSRGALTEAADWIELGERAIATGDGRTGAEVLMTAKSRLLEATGDLASANSHLRETWDLFEALDAPISLLALCPDAIRLAIATSDKTFLDRISVFLHHFQKQVDSPRVEAYSHCLDALLAGETAAFASSIEKLRYLGRHAEAQTLLSIGHTPKRSNEVPSPQAAISSDVLSIGERKVAELIRTDFSNKAIAAELGISRRTVETHVTRVLRKLNVDSRTQVAVVLQFS
jgi:ATP/maltotriose-dependent transcriptional regulator MalT